MKYTIQQAEKYLKEKTQTEWTGFNNSPFYIDLEKPAPSLSTRDEYERSYWLPQDALFVLWCANGGIQMLLDRIKELKEELKYSVYNADEI